MVYLSLGINRKIVSTVVLYPLLPSKMDVNHAANGELVYTYYRDYDENGLNLKGGYITLRKDDVLHIPGLGFDGLVGYSPIAMAKSSNKFSNNSKIKESLELLKSKAESIR